MTTDEIERATLDGGVVELPGAAPAEPAESRDPVGAGAAGHDWRAAFAAHGSRWLPGDNSFAPYSYERPDGTLATVAGSVRIILRAAGNWTGRAPLSYLVRPGQYSAPSGSAVDSLFGMLRGPHYHCIGTGTVSDLRVHVGPPINVPVVSEVDAECEECGGSGEVTCYACDHDHECEECFGTGRVCREETHEPPLRVLRLAGKIDLDARALAQMVALLPDGNVRVSAAIAAPSARAVLIEGDGWDIVIMPILSPYDAGTPVTDWALEECGA